MIRNLYQLKRTVNFLTLDMDLSVAAVGNAMKMFQHVLNLITNNIISLEFGMSMLRFNFNCIGV